VSPRLWLLVFALTAAALPCRANAQGLPNGFVYLSEIEPSIRQDIRYATPHNFIGRPIAGYGANECILTRKAAQALAQVQAELSARQLSLIVWDCYRPVRAVNDFVAWSRNARDQAMKAEFYPNLGKDSLFALGYIAARSAHSRGSTVDLGIVPADLQTVPAFKPGTPLVACTAAKGARFDDGTVDLGTGYDCLDPRAGAHPSIGREAMENRNLLKAAMARRGFRSYFREWWHFTLATEPFPSQGFDFPIVARR
jgi:D-alanyl-D-alanine dipeptidase